jgi:hypothetical protein
MKIRPFLPFITKSVMTCPGALLGLVACLTLAAPQDSAAKDKPEHKAWTDAAAAAKEDPDFAAQGEYTGMVDGEAWGLQIIAEGGGKFKVTAYPGGLPGDGFTGDAAGKLQGKAERKDDGSVEVAVGEHKGTLKDGVITGDAGEFKKVSRKSPTLGEAPPTGATVLFDGKSADAFPGAKLDGEWLCQGITSKQSMGSGRLHVEFLVPYQPTARGQGRGNSGCYLQGRYEVQILDSFGLKGENNECGGIYTIGAPTVNMAFPPLAWQTYDIEFIQAEFDAQGKKTKDAIITVKHNGVVVQNKTALTHATTAAPRKEGPEPAPLYFQDHGNPVRYRNIWWVEAR